MFCFIKISSGDVSDTEVIERQSSFLHFGQTRFEQSKPVFTLTVLANPQTAQLRVALNFILITSYHIERVFGV